MANDVGSVDLQMVVLINMKVTPGWVRRDLDTYDDKFYQPDY